MSRAFGMRSYSAIPWQAKENEQAFKLKPPVWITQPQRTSMTSQRKRTGVQTEAAGVEYAATAHFHDKPKKKIRRPNCCRRFGKRSHSNDSMTSQRKRTGVQIVAAGPEYPAQSHDKPKKPNRLEFVPARLECAATAQFHGKPKKTNRRSN